MRTLFWAMAFWTLSGWGLVACTPFRSGPLSSSTGSLSSGVGFSQLKSQIFGPKCITCHQSGNEPDFTSYATLMAGSSVLTGRPELSPLYLRIADGSMPSGGPRLSASEVQEIYGWILAGALDDSAISAPLAPSDLTAQPASPAQISLSWVDGSTNETGFQIERSLSASGPFSPVGTASTDTTTYQDAGLTASTTYYYRVTAVNANGHSPYTSVVSATTLAPSSSPPTPPSNLVVSTVTDTQITMAWTDNSDNETGFKIERSSDGAKTFSQVTIVAAGTTFYTDGGLQASTFYSYRLRATNALGDSNYSNTITVSTAGATDPATFTWLNRNIFQPKCVACHSGGSASGGYDMSTYAGVLNKVVAGNSAASAIYTECASGNMPQGGNLLLQSQLNALKNWIDNGALDN